MELIFRIGGRENNTLNKTKNWSSVIINDSEGSESDTAIIVVPKKTGLSIPPQGERIGFFTEKGKRLGPGDFEINSVSHSQREGQAIISCIAYNPEAFLKVKQDRSFAGKNIKDIVSAIADESGLMAEVSQALSLLTPRGAVMANQSPMQFLRRLAEEQDAKITIKNGRLVFYSRSGESNSGRKLPTLVIDNDAPDVWLSWDINQINKYQSVRAKYLQPDGATPAYFQTSAERPQHKLQDVHPSLDAAQKSARNALKNLNQSALKLKAELTLLPVAQAGFPMRIDNRPTDLPDSKLTIQTVRHVVKKGAHSETTINAASTEK